MSQFEMFNAGNDEAAQKKSLAWLLRQVSAGKATTGVLTGLGVTQTTTASGSVVIGAGAGEAQAAVLDGASLLVNDTPLTLDVFGANPMGGLDRNDIVIFDWATLSPVSGGTASGGLRVLIGDGNATPTDPTIPSTAIPLARLRHAASATTIPTSKIDDLRVKTSVFGGADENFVVQGVPMAGASTAKAGKRIHWGTVTTGATDASGYRTITHGAGFTPTTVTGTNAAGYQMGVDSITSTTFRIRFLQADGSVFAGASSTLNYFCGE